MTNEFPGKLGPGQTSASARDQNGSNFDALQRAVAGENDGRTVFVDFDHTLLLANSSEKFLDSARPRIIFAPLLKLLGALQPWRIAGSNGKFVWRELIRFMIVLLLAPWTLILFKNRARRVFASHLNHRLDDVLKTVDPKQIIIVSFGFRFVIEAMIKGTRYEQARVIAPSLLDMARYRRLGKIKMLADLGIEPDPTRDILVTDSAEDDADLLAQTRFPIVIQWPENDTTGALEGAYVPLFYTAKIKRTPSFLVKQVFLEEVLLVIVAFSVFASAFSLSLMVGIGALMTAFLLVYEVGYAENDRVGFHTEENPKLTKNFFRFRGYQLEPYAWIWATLASIIGIWAFDDATNLVALDRLHLSGLGMGVLGHAALVMVWMGVLAASRISFYVFNHVPLRARVFAYFPLHTIKYFGLAALLPLHFVCFALLAAQIVRTWSIYAVRRSGGDVDFVASQSVRLFIFILMIVLLTAAIGPGPVLGIWQTWVLIAFCIARAAPEAWKKLIRRPNSDDNDLGEPQHGL